MSAVLPTSSTKSISITSFGAVADGVTNNQAAIQNAFNYAAANGDAVYIPPGEFAYSGILTANGIAVYGAGTSSVLIPLDVANESLTLTGSGGSISNLQMDSSGPTRLSSWQSSMIWIDQAQNYTVANVLINGSSSGGIFDDGGQNGLIENNTVENTLADSITNTNGAANVTITGNRILNAGDDGISTVSYAAYPIVHNITVTGNTVLNNLWGRGISVLGGNNVQITGNYVQGGPAGMADVYLAAESEWDTLGVNSVTISGNTLVNGGGAPSGSGQGAISIYNSQGSSYSITGVTISGNQIVNPLSQALWFDGNGAESVAVQNNTIYTSGTTLAATAGAPLAVVSMTGNQMLAPSAYSTPVVAPGGGVTTTPTPTPSPTVITVAATQANVTVSVSNATINATSGNHMFLISGHADAFNLSGGAETINDSGSGGNTFNLPTVGHGSAVFNAAVLADSDVFDLKAALAGTTWAGSANTLGSYLHPAQSGATTRLLVSTNASKTGGGTLLATFESAQVSLSTILAHSIT